MLVLGGGPSSQEMRTSIPIEFNLNFLLGTIQSENTTELIVLLPLQIFTIYFHLPSTGIYHRVLFENRPALYFLIIHLFLSIKYIFLFRIKDTVSDILSVLLNFIANNYDSKNENIAQY